MSDEENTEEVEVQEVAQAAVPQKPEQAPISFYDALLVHKKAIDEKFPKATEAEKTAMAVACLDAHMSVLHANTIARALALPDRETMYEDLQDLQRRHVDLTRQYQNLTAAYKNVQRQLNVLDRRR